MRTEYWQQAVEELANWKKAQIQKADFYEPGMQMATTILEHHARHYGIKDREQICGVWFVIVPDSDMYIGH